MDVMNLLLTLLQQMSVFLVLAYLFSKSPAFRPVAGRMPRRWRWLLIYAVFTSFSILGTYFGLPVQGAIANTRAIGAVLAGLIAGPWMGLAVGLTSGLHRFSLGGFTAFSCGVSTTMEGLLGGLVYLYLRRRGRVDQVYSPAVAFATTFAAELLQMVIILLLAQPRDEALQLVRVIALPMTLANATGAALFISMMRCQKSMVEEMGALFSAKAVRVAERTLQVLIRGLTPETAGQLARIIHEETGVAAVAISDRENVLAFVGKGSDHHLPGYPIANQLVREAILGNRGIYLDGIERPYVCPLQSDCPMGFEAKNIEYLDKIVKDEGVTLRKFPTEVLTGLKKLALEVLDEVAAGDADSKKVYDHIKAFRAKVGPWAEITEQAMNDTLKL